MIEVALIVIALCAFGYALVAQRLGQGVVTGPMVAIGLGLIMASVFGDQGAHLEGTLHTVAEITLVAVLFSDASMLRARWLRGNTAVPLRLLGLGLPLAMLFGYVVGRFLLPDWSGWEIALLAAILAPTDAALGQAVVTNIRVPERLRNALIVESGLNDGLALPAILFFGCIAVGGVHDNVQSNWVVFTAEQIGLGTLTGVAIGAAGGWLMTFALRRGLTTEVVEGIAALALAALCYLIAVEIGGNGFLAAFSGGLCFGIFFEKKCKFVLEFLETEGQLLVLGTFVLLGVVISGDLLHAVTPAWLCLILLSLFVTRPLAIWLSLTGSGSPPSERLFLGWFGPRGLATALFALLVLDEFEGLAHGEEILLIAFLAVIMSTVLHGVSAAPIAGRFSPPPAPATRKDPL